MENFEEILRKYLHQFLLSSGTAALALVFLMGCQTNKISETQRFEASIRKELPFRVWRNVVVSKKNQRLICIDRYLQDGLRGMMSVRAVRRNTALRWCLTVYVRYWMRRVSTNGEKRLDFHQSR